MGRDGYAVRRSWIAAAPVAELPPRTRIEAGACPSVDRNGKNGRGIFKLLTMPLTAVAKHILISEEMLALSKPRVRPLKMVLFTYGNEAASSRLMFFGFLARNFSGTTTCS